MATKNNSIIAQVSSLKAHRLAAVLGFILGGFVPAAVWFIAHYQTKQRAWLWLFVAGGLIYSATTVYQWGTLAFGGRIKPLGFVLLLEGTMTFACGFWLPFAALALLVSINGTATAYSLVSGQPKTQPAASKARRRASQKQRRAIVAPAQHEPLHLAPTMEAAA